ncbi:MAG: helix-turn-helix domain-containing protein [Cohaesibacter sp.]|nr:helix-turn-helix domain-containing protein [Cohaesibacter sp.]
MSDYVGEWARRQNCGGPVGKALLLALAGRADGSGRCFPGRARLLADTEMSERSLRTWVAKLEEAKLLRRERYNGYQEVYILLIDKGEKAVDMGEEAAGFAANAAGETAGAAAETANAAAGAADLANAAGDSSANAAGETAGAAGQTANAAAPYKEGKNNQKKTKEKPLNLLSCSSEGDVDEEWERFCQTWKLNEADSFAKAWREWDGLSDEERTLAVEHAVGFQRATKARSYPTSAKRYLADKLWQGQAQQSVNQSNRSLVFIRRDSDEWKAWVAHRHGRQFPHYSHRETGEFGWFVESSWPPCHAEGLQGNRAGARS